jgi:hypothetical protein
MPPCILGEAVVERQCRHIETEIGRALDVGVSTENIGTGSGMANISGNEQQDAAGANVRSAGGELGLPHGPDQGRRALLGEYFGDALDLRLRQTGDALHFSGWPFLDLPTHVFRSIDPLADEFRVLPGEAGPSQKATAIESAIRCGRKCSKRAAARLLL